MKEYLFFIKLGFIFFLIFDREEIMDDIVMGDELEDDEISDDDFEDDADFDEF